MSGVRALILLASVMVCLFEDAASTSPIVNPLLPIPMCKATNCRLFQKCTSMQKKKCTLRSANLQCIPPDVDSVCGKINQLALLVGKPRKSSLMKPRKCSISLTCPSGTTCYNGHCCYGTFRRNFLYCKCPKGCSPGYSCQQTTSSDGQRSHACLPIVDKPGTCPTLPPGVAVKCEGPYSTTCNHDGDCKDNMKCCNGPCMKACMVPNTLTEIIVKLGNCPSLDPRIQCSSPFENIVDQCNQDGDCEGEAKCCPQHCTGKMCEAPQIPDPVVTKPGNCPTLDPRIQCSSPFENIVDQCNQDGDCEGEAKCCPKHCTGKMCEAPQIPDPVVTKPGNCPTLDQGIYCSSPFENIVDQCNQDGDCEGEAKCCPQHCTGKMCEAPQIPDPVVAKPGNCPTLDPRIQCSSPFENIVDQCNQDGDCEGEAKCCPSSCAGKMCKTPELE